MPTPTTFPVFLDSFESPTLYRIISLLNSTSSTSSIDPLPLPILKQFTHTVATPLHKFICISLSSGSVPSDFKVTSNHPHLKKPNLDSLNSSNYQPISNLLIHSNFLERVVSSHSSPTSQPTTSPTSSKAPTCPTNLLNPP